MHRNDKIVLIGSVIAMFSLVAIVFFESLPNFCANPQGSGNWIVQPLCKE